MACASTPAKPQSTISKDPQRTTKKHTNGRRIKGVGPRHLGGGAKTTAAGSGQLKIAKKKATKGDLKGAVIATRAAIQENPSLVEAYLLLGSLFDLAGNPLKAKGVYKNGLAAGAEPARLYHALGLLALEANQINDAIQALGKADEHTRPPNADLKADLGYAYLLAGNTQQGLLFAERAQKLNPKSFAAAYTLGEAYLRTKSFSDAIRAFESATKISPSENSAHRRLAQALNQAGEFERAKEVFITVLKNNPEDIKSHVALAEVWISLKAPEKAVASMKRALELSPANPSLLQLMAHTYEQAGMKQKAREIIMQTKETKRTR